MAEENSLEIFHDVIEASIEFLYDEYRKKYFDLFFLTVDNILAGEVLNDLSDDKKAKLEKIYEPIKNMNLDVESIRKALQAIVLKGFSEQKISNGGITPDTIGMLFAYLISKFEPTKRHIRLFDPLAGVGNLLFTIINHLDLEIDAIACEHNELSVKIMQSLSDMLQTELEIYFQDTRNVNVSNLDYIVCDFDYSNPLDGKYFPYEVILHHVKALNDNGVMMCLIPNDFFSYDKDQKFKKELNEENSMIGLIELPDTFFKNNQKSIILIQRAHIENKKCMMVKLPSFNDSKRFNEALAQIETWFENNINKK